MKLSLNIQFNLHPNPYYVVESIRQLQRIFVTLPDKKDRQKFSRFIFL